MNKKKRVVKSIKILGGIAAAAILVLCASIWSSYHLLTVRSWEISSEKIANEMTIAVLSDLHTSEFGEQNQKLVAEIREQSPDMILLAGDMINEDAENDAKICQLVADLCQIAPLYYGIGNHEIGYMSRFSENANEASGIYFHLNRKNPFLLDLEEAGAVVLDTSYTDVTVKGNPLRIGGLYNYAFGLENDNSAAMAPEFVHSFLTEMESTDAYRIVMSHRPDSFIFGDASTYWDLDLVISGHNHGGQVAFGNHGLYGGDQGFFPTYIHGLYKKDQLELFITSGLGSQTERLPRINNRPEIAILKFGGAE